MTIQIPRDVRFFLRSKLLGKSCAQLSNENIDFLKFNLLVNRDTTLTEEGRLYAIAMSSLDIQSDQLGIVHDRLNIVYKGAPEEYALSIFLNTNYIGVNAEGYFLHAIIKALLLDLLTELNTFKDRNDAIQRYLPAQFIILKNYKQRILSSISKDNFICNYREIINNQFISEVSKGLCTQHSMSIECASYFLRIISYDNLKIIINALIDEPNLCFGWPDLTLIKDNGLYLKEIKTTDKLNLNQIQVINKFKSIKELNFGIFQFTKA